MRSGYLDSGNHRVTSRPRSGFTMMISSFDAIPGIPSNTIQRSSCIIVTRGLGFPPKLRRQPLVIGRVGYLFYRGITRATNIRFTKPLSPERPTREGHRA